MKSVNAKLNKDNILGNLSLSMCHWADYKIELTRKSFNIFLLHSSTMTTKQITYGSRKLVPVLPEFVLSWFGTCSLGKKKSYVMTPNTWRS